MASKREVELELEVWQARTESVQNGLAALNAQAQLLQTKSAECAQNTERLQRELADMHAAEKAAAEAAAQAAQKQAAEPAVVAEEATAQPG